MKKFLFAMSLPLLTFMPYNSYAATAPEPTDGSFLISNIVLLYTGPAKPNPKPEIPEIFQPACDCSPTGCTPSTTFPAINATTGRVEGEVFVWTKDGITSPDGKTQCFTELIEYKLRHGNIYTIGNKNGTCGVLADPTLIPVANDPVTIVGGGSGNIVGGTKLYSDLKGTYVDRVYVGLTATGTIDNYSGLFFSLMPKRKI
jgi:hypothetical protein